MTIKIALMGHARSGKDTFAKPLITGNSDELPLLTEIKFASPISSIIEEYFPEQEGKPRELYQKIGQSMREIDPDVWVNYLDDVYHWNENSHHRMTKGIILTDVRQPNEWQWCREQGFTVVKIDCPLELRIERAMAAGDQFNVGDMFHETEQYIDQLPADITVTNVGSVGELETKAWQLCNMLLKEDKDD